MEGFFPSDQGSLAVPLVLTSYMGIEVIAVTAGEAEDPHKLVPKAMRTIVFRLIIFYVIAILAMLAMTPWRQLGSENGLAGSPFVRGFTGIGIPYAASIMNLVVITAALSSCNTDLYLTTRMLFSLATGRICPVMAWAPGTECHFGLWAFPPSAWSRPFSWLFYAPSQAFLLLYGVAVAECSLCGS